MATSLPEEQCVPVDRDQDANVLDQLRDWARDNFVLFWPIPVVGTLASLGLFKAGLLAATLAFLLTLAYWLILLLFMSRRLGATKRRHRREVAQLRRRNELQYQEVLGRGEVLLRYMRKAAREQLENPESYDIRDLWQTFNIADNGDTQVRLDLRIQVGVQQLDFCSGICKTDSDVGDKNAVHVEAYWLDASGQQGARLDVLPDWESDHNCRIYTYFTEPRPPHDVFELRYVWVWPGYSSRLVNGEAEDARWKFHRRCDRLSCQLILEQGLEHFPPPLVTAFPGSPRPGVTRRPKDGAHVVQFEVCEPAMDENIGFTVDLGPRPSGSITPDRQLSGAPQTFWSAADRVVDLTDGSGQHV